MPPIKVRWMVRSEDEDWMDIEFMDSCAEAADPNLRLEEVRHALSTIRGSIVVSKDRGEY